MDIGKRLREFRLAHQLTQQELAVRAGVSKGFISLLESNKSSVSIETLSEVLAVLGEQLSSFFRRTRCSRTSSGSGIEHS